MSADFRLNIHLYPSDMTKESRIFKISDFLTEVDFFDSIELIGMKCENLAVQEKIQDKVQIIRISPIIFEQESNFRSVNVLAWSFKVFFYCLKRDIACINCHTLTLLPISTLLKFFKRCKLVYDTHELETEKNGTQSLRKLVSKCIESLFINSCDLVVTVNESIADYYRCSYPQVSSRVTFVRNIPTFKQLPVKTEYLRDHFQITDNKPIFLYQGVIGAGRSIEILIQVFRELEDRACVVFLGYGSYVDLIKKQAGNNIFYHEAVGPKQVLSITASADYGLCLIENTSLSYYLCLPNKLFEYLSSGLPVLASNFPELMNVVSKNNVGEVCDPKDVVRIKEKILKMCEHSTSEVYAENLKEIKKSLSWANEADRMGVFYKRWVLP